MFSGAIKLKVIGSVLTTFQDPIALVLPVVFKLKSEGRKDTAFISRLRHICSNMA